MGRKHPPQAQENPNEMIVFPRVLPKGVSVEYIPKRQGWRFSYSSEEGLKNMVKLMIRVNQK